MGHFWNNDVVGNLQGQFDLVWQTVANYFKNNPWVVGYDPYNEPFETETTMADGSTFTGNLAVLLHGPRPRELPGQRDDPARLPV